jgi:hypothetical protein
VPSVQLFLKVDIFGSFLGLTAQRGVASPKKSFVTKLIKMINVNSLIVLPVPLRPAGFPEADAS